MLSVPAGDESLTALRGALMPSTVFPGVTYRVEHALGTGSMAVAFLCEREGSEGTSPCVIKLIKPGLVIQAAETALLTIRKEAVALGRLNESVPPTPFVVRFIENGELAIQYGHRPLTLPWLAMEYVHGSTLEDRIGDSVRQTGKGFDIERAILCIDSIAHGLHAVHSVNVLHRDIKPNNVLCCGIFPDEVFKLSDFGVARPVGLKQTFVEGSMGTPGYASPEQVLMDQERLGPASDVFSFAATAFSILTGQDLFSGRTVVEVVQSAQRRERRSILESSFLVDELASRPDICAGIDAAISHATSPDARDRPQSARIFASTIIAALRAESVRPPTVSIKRSMPSAPRPQGRYRWAVRQAGRSDLAIRSVAWDGSGSCLAVTTSGLHFWNGTDWTRAQIDAKVESAVRCVHRVSPGVWLLGGTEGQIAYYAAAENLQALRRPRSAGDFFILSGAPEDVAVAFASRRGGAPVLFGAVGRRWLKELPLPKGAFILGLARFDEERWILAGRGTDGGIAALYSPLRWELEMLKTKPVRVFTACAAAPEVGVGFIVGSAGTVIRVTEQGPTESTVPGEPDLSAVMLEVNQRAWAASLGKIWMQLPHANEWTCAWQDPGWQVPIVSLFADGVRVIGVAADGAIIEGGELHS